MRSTGVSAIWNQACQLLIWWTQFSLCTQHSVCALIPVNSYSFWTGSCPRCWRGKGKKKKKSVSATQTGKKSCSGDRNDHTDWMWPDWPFHLFSLWSTVDNSYTHTTNNNRYQNNSLAFSRLVWSGRGSTENGCYYIGLQSMSNWKSDHSLLILPDHCQANLIKPRPHIPEEADELSL